MSDQAQTPSTEAPNVSGHKAAGQDSINYDVLFENLSDDVTIDKDGNEVPIGGKPKATKTKETEANLEASEDDLEIVDDVEDDVEMSDDDVDADDDDYVTIDDESIKEFKVKGKANGEEWEATVDELIQERSLYLGARKSLQEASAMKANLEKVVDQLRNPELLPTVLEKLGLDFNKVAEDHLLQQYRLKKMSPEERELHEYKQQLKQRNEEVQRYREEKERMRMEQLAEEYKKEVKPQIENALKSVGLAQNKVTFARVAKTMHDFMQMGQKVTPAYAAKLVKDELKQELSSLASSSSTDALESLFEDDKSKAGLKKARARKQQLRVAKKVKSGEERQSGVKPSKKYGSYEEFINSLGE